ncbi:hypothetical protein ScPMuIL_018670 [Solemya velum]
MVLISLARSADSERRDTEVRHRHRRATEFKRMWVTQCGAGFDKPEGASLEVAVTVAVSDTALRKAAKLVYLMVRFMPPSIFLRLTEKSSVGLFNSDEYISEFPEYDSQGACISAGSCSDPQCNKFCTVDSRPIYPEWSYGGPRAVSVDGNLMCGEELYNPNEKENLLITAFAETILKYGLSESLISQINSTYTTAMQHNTWRHFIPNVMRVSKYFKAATSVWFAGSPVMKNSDTGGMHICSCHNEWDYRQNIKQNDPALYALLNEIYNNKREYLEGRLHMCDW